MRQAKVMQPCLFFLISNTVLAGAQNGLATSVSIPLLDGKLLTKQEQKQSFTFEREDFCPFSLQCNVFLVRLFFISSFSMNTPKAAE